MSKCNVEHCELKVYGHGLCSKHYTQMRNHGEIKSRTIFTPNDFIQCGDHYKMGCYDKDCNLVDYVLIDSDDLDKVRDIKWCLDGKGYARNNNHNIYLHNLIMGIDTLQGVEVDYDDCNPLNCRKNNLRICTHKENCRNRKIYKNNTSRFKGVSRRGDKWESRIKVSYKTIHLGFFDTPIDAARAYNKAARELHGEYAVLNKI